ncbi:ribosomal protein S18-alanine N-acetyltransferase [Streptococcus caprae]|uniref:[Ribosomal protein bS18]-alanine N-acetyltransferase n=1 Tax=Streptococcus caprae TaxID=1640501 RepID=A0ABV8CT23_9STRE
MKTTEQAQVVHQILQATYGQSPWNLDQIQADMEQESTHYYFVQHGGQVVGFLSLQDMVGESELTNIAIMPEFQGMGLAHQLMKQLISNPQPIFLEVREGNTKAQQLYRAYGFKEVGRRKAYYHNPTEDALLMKREGR